MFFDDQPKDYEPMTPEELNKMIAVWGKELFAEEKRRRSYQAILNDGDSAGRMPVATRLRLAVVRSWNG